jgi:hypothetical protein
MVTAQSDDTRQGLAIFGRTFLVRIGSGSTAKDGVVSFFNLMEGVGIIVSNGK